MTPEQMASRIDQLEATVDLLAQEQRAMLETVGRMLSARALVVDGQFVAQLRGLVSGEKAALPEQQERVVCIFCAQDRGMPFLDEVGFKGPLALRYFVETTGQGWMFPRAAK